LWRAAHGDTGAWRTNLQKDKGTTILSVPKARVSKVLDCLTTFGGFQARTA
jgi:hypothetical protein